MIKRSFFGFAKPKLQYEILDDVQAAPVSVKPSKAITFYVGLRENDVGEVRIKEGDGVKCGEKIIVSENSDDYIIPSRSGRISKIDTFIGIMGKKYLTVSIDADSESAQVKDEGFKNISQAPTLENAREFLSMLPGKPDFNVFFNPEKPVRTIVVLGVDDDLLTTTNQYFVNNHILAIKTGIDLISKISGVSNTVLVVPQYLEQVAGSCGAVVKTVDSEYPTAHPELIRQYILASETEDAGSEIAFFSAESVCAIGIAYTTGNLALEKIISFVNKDEICRLISAPIGTPAQDILDLFNETLEDGERLIFGGPMKGVSVYRSDYPVMADTDTLMIQDKTQVPERSDIACSNCGDCIRVCPANIQVNHLIRLLEAGQYDEAAESYDLFSCIECGFCSYVCESRIPLFQHIKLAKHTLESMKAAEEINA